MFFEWWMIALVVAAYIGFGITMFLGGSKAGAKVGFKLGVNSGIASTLKTLADQKVIRMTDKEILPYVQESSN